jgi:hypothetical protein
MLSPMASRIVFRILLIFGVILLGGALLWGIAGVGPGVRAPERQADMLPPEDIRAALAGRDLEVLSLERDGGLYVAEVRGADGAARTVHLDGATGTVIGMPEVTGPAIATDALRRRLLEAGYSEIGPIGWSKGAYRTRATGPDGQRWALALHTYSGEILERAPE